jgi:heme/copper-type cytochrome/quinol oxidase subunit 4
MVPAPKPAPPASAWLANPPIDLAMAFGWVPFYVWLRTTPVVGDIADAAFLPALKLAAVIALSVNFVHRHFVYFLFFGDEKQRALHPRALWLAPLIVVALVLPTRLWCAPAFGVVVGAFATWNVWHTLMQRHGIARAYAVKSGGGLDTREHGRRELRMLWALAVCTAAFVIMFRQDTFYGRAQRTFARVHVVVAQEHSGIGWVLVVVAGAVAAAMVIAWARTEAQASPRVGRAPRLVFWASSVCLLGICVVHGPVVGFLVFGFAHSLEYILFVYLFSRRRIVGGETAPSARMFGRAAPLVTVSALLLALFVAARQVWTVPLFVVYYTATSALHYFYDGLIWKMRRPEVRAPLVAWASNRSSA